MKYDGVGEYHCEDCNSIDYDDYGIVRTYIEKHPGANAAEVEAATGIPQKTIRQMLKEERLEVREDSATFLRCERCGASIRSGRLCGKCVLEVSKEKELQKKAGQKKNIQGYSGELSGATGKKRYQQTDRRKPFT